MVEACKAVGLPEPEYGTDGLFVWITFKRPESREKNISLIEQAPEQVRGLLHTSNSLILELVKVIGEEELSISQLMEKIGLKHRSNFIEYHLNPTIKEGYVRLLYPDKPRHPRQKYLLTVKGLALYNELTKVESRKM